MRRPRLDGERNSRHSPALAERRKLLVFLDEEYLRQQNRITRRMPNESKVDRLEVVLQQIGSESFEAVRAREKRTFASFAGPNEERLVLFGAGALGRLVLQGPQQAGMRPIAFADNNERLWYTELEPDPQNRDAW